MTATRVETMAELEDALTRPSPALIQDLQAIDGDLVVVGAGGKIGPTLARMARRALDACAPRRRVVAVSRFGDRRAREELERHGVETVTADLLGRDAIAGLPDAPNVLCLVGTKFGTTGNEAATWATNAFATGLIAERYAGSRMVVFSTGNVYPLAPLHSGGSTERSPTGPIGEYAQSCLARERIVEHWAWKGPTPAVLLRLNYAIDLRYGVLTDIAQAVRDGDAVDLSMPCVNVIWQGDVNEIALRCLKLASTPPLALNVTGPETVSVRWLAETFGRRFGVEPVFRGAPADTALLSNAADAFGRFGYPRVTLATMIEWVAAWLEIGGEMLHKPTHFEQRQGAF